MPTETCNKKDLIKTLFLVSGKCLAYVKAPDICLGDICAPVLILQSHRHKIKSSDFVRDVTASDPNSFFSWNQKIFCSLRHPEKLRFFFKQDCLVSACFWQAICEYCLPVWVHHLFARCEGWFNSFVLLLSCIFT